MKKNLSAISLIVLSLVTACASPITNLKTLQDNEITSKNNVKTTISGKAEFPSSDKKLSIKATLAEVGVNATVSVIYTSEHPSFANKTIATGLTDTNGNFSINPDINFTPALNEIFVLEASKRIGSTGKAVITVRTFIKWNGNTWDSITSPSLNINTKTTALASMIELLSPSVNANDSIGKILVSENISTPSDIKHLDVGNTIIKADSINKVANLLIDYTLSKNQDPLEYLVYQNGEFTIKEPNKILSEIISTIAGNGNLSFLGDSGQATNSILNGPSGIAFDSNGNLYIVDTNNSIVRKIDKITGIISTIAGSKGCGFSGDGGQGTNSKLCYPRGIAFDSTGNLYIADSANNRIRKVDKLTGVITTVVGNGTQGFSGDGSIGSLAKINYPMALTFDSSGNFYIADYKNNRIRKIDKTTGIISTFAGDGSSGYGGDGGQATNAKLNFPIGLAFDSLGNIHIADSSNYRIRKIDKATGVITTIVGTGISGYNGDNIQSSTAQITYTPNIAFDSIGNLYIADSVNRRIRKIDKLTGIISTVVGNGIQGFSGDEGQAINAQLSTPNSIIFDINNNMYISDFLNNRIRRIDNSTGIISTIVGGGGLIENVPATSTELEIPSSITFNSIDNMYVSDFWNNRIRKIDKVTGIISTVAGNSSTGYNGDGMQASNSSLYNPSGTAFDSSGNLYIADTYNHRIRKVDKVTGIISTFAGNGSYGFSGDGGPAINAKLDAPTQIIFDITDNLYITDSSNHRIRKIDKATGIISTFAGNGSYGFSSDGDQATNAQLFFPRGLAFDSTGNLYIADSANDRIRKVDKLTGIISTVAGTYGMGSGDGSLATNATLRTPNSIIFDSNGNIYISDNGNNKIRKVDGVTGIITTIAGTGTSGFSGDGGLATNSQLNIPSGIAFDSMGNLYISDTDNNRIRKVTLIHSIQP